MQMENVFLMIMSDQSRVVQDYLILIIVAVETKLTGVRALRIIVEWKTVDDRVIGHAEWTEMDAKHYASCRHNC
jgi:hypothetical protein